MLNASAVPVMHPHAYMNSMLLNVLHRATFVSDKMYLIGNCSRLENVIIRLGMCDSYIFWIDISPSRFISQAHI